MSRTLLPPLLLLAAAAAAAALPPPATAPRPAFPVGPPAGAAVAWEARLGADAPTPLTPALELGRRLDGVLKDEDRHRFRFQLEAYLAGLGRRPDAARLPWAAWLERCRLAHRRVAPGLMRAAGQALGPAAMDLAWSVDRRSSPVELRVAAMQVLWRLKPVEGANAAQKALRERPRLDLHERVVAEVLAPAPGPLADELLIDAAGAGDRVAERARRLAVQALGRRRVEAATGVLGQILASSRGDVLLRKAAGEALYAIGSPAALRAILAVDDVDPGAQPVFHAYLDQLRQRLGYPPLG
ncbi:MAG: hypothetical protein D6702_09635 [Planctomycetota bacterium]|nr:MAG: hypothetical protein D6702_09635 [Planctomycetota bacterium]